MTPSPMLAHKYADYPGLVYPSYGQPKLDGVRCLTYMEDEALVCMSRNGKPLHIAPCIHNLPESMLCMLHKGYVLDGELYIHGKGFQTVVSIVKRKDHEDNHTLQYHVYDGFYFDPVTGDYHDLMYHRRELALRWAFEGLDQEVSGIHLVKTQLLNNETEASQFHMDMVAAGYEGSMLRLPAGLYRPTRSKALLKRKDFKDDEFIISNVLEGEGKNAGTAVLVCTARNNLPFSVTAPGDYREKAQAWKDRSKLIGTKVNVKYQELSDQGIPRFPIATGFPVDKD